ncbi:hypothetical protein BDF19DRAFT_463844 [Syncephalis fuscata]|nr:hypothetical protein BDF19DRAFT_463844 [Syncephalis fuscata]
MKHKSFTLLLFYHLLWLVHVKIVVSQNDKHFAMRHGHTATILGNKLYLIGGAGNAFDSNSYIKDEQMVTVLDLTKPFDLASPAWKNPSKKDNQPPPLIGHVTVADPKGQYLLVVGGYTPHKNDTKTAWRYTPANNEWNALPLENGPAQRSVFMAGAANNETIYINGGASIAADAAQNETTKKSEDVKITQKKKLQIESLDSLQLNTEPGYIWNNNALQWGRMPLDRDNFYGHTLSYVLSKQVFIAIGGKGGNTAQSEEVSTLSSVRIFTPSSSTWNIGQNPYGDVAVLNTKSWKWTKPELEYAPTGHAFGQAVLVNNAYMFVLFGYVNEFKSDADLHILNINTWKFVGKYPGIQYSQLHSGNNTSVLMGIIIGCSLVSAAMFIAVFFFVRKKLRQAKDKPLESVLPSYNPRAADDSNDALSIEGSNSCDELSVFDKSELYDAQTEEFKSQLHMTNSNI